ncbi:MAG: feruloyl-CoA synthase [Rhodospirillales bacterium]|nr:feruloyl-CoA synthase [Rhodospirillales bacterium]
MSAPPYAPIDLAPARVTATPLAGGGWLLESPDKLTPHWPHLVAALVHWAEAAPARTFLAERDAGGGWRRLTYADAAAQSARIAQALLDRGISADRPAMVLSDNGIDHALLLLGAMQAGAPLAPISPAYSLMSQDHGKLRHIFALLRPGLVYASDGQKFARALAALDLKGVEVAVSANPPAGIAATAFSDLLAAPAGPAVATARSALGPDTIVKFLFTSGSTGIPKGVVNTQRMLCSNQQGLTQIWRFLAARPPVLVDWLPWNHTFGGNHNFNLVLWNGGTMYIDDGKPAPGLIDRTARNLGEIAPTIYFNVPRGYDMLLPFLERDADLRRRLFGELDLLHYAGAALPRSLWERLEAQIVAVRGQRIFMASSWGSTETAPMATAVHYRIAEAGNIGLPAPGVAVKLVPESGRLEMRVKGPNVTPGYWRDPAQTAAAFDADGYLRMGDAGRLADPADPARGLVFDGRIGENFKLMSGTWVEVGTLRVGAIAAAQPAIQDAVVAGHDRENIGLLVFPSLAGCRALCPEAGAEATLAELIARPALREKIAAGLAAWNRAHPGNSTRIARALLMAEPPSIDANEITDKGYINQRAVLTRRAALVERLFAGKPGPDVIAPAGGGA